MYVTHWNSWALVGNRHRQRILKMEFVAAWFTDGLQFRWLFRKIVQIPEVYWTTILLNYPGHIFEQPRAVLSRWIAWKWSSTGKVISHVLLVNCLKTDADKSLGLDVWARQSFYLRILWRGLHTLKTMHVYANIEVAYRDCQKDFPSIVARLKIAWL